MMKRVGAVTPGDARARRAPVRGFAAGGGRMQSRSRIEAGPVGSFAGRAEDDVVESHHDRVSIIAVRRRALERDLDRTRAPGRTA